jgi:hypothetical protein
VLTRRERPQPAAFIAVAQRTCATARQTMRARLMWRVDGTMRWMLTLRGHPYHMVHIPLCGEDQLKRERWPITGPGSDEVG